MVLEGRGRSVGTVLPRVDRKNTSQTISTLVYSALTIRPVPRESIKDSYWTALLLGVLLTIAMVAGLMVGVGIKLGVSAVAENKEMFVVHLVARLVILMIGCLVASYLNCMVIGAAHSAKEYEIFLSSTVYIPVLLPLAFVFRLLFSIGTLALVLLNSFYLNSCYSPMLPYDDARLSMMHHVYILVVLWLVYTLLLFPTELTK